MRDTIVHSLETGKIPVYHLKRFWDKSIKKRNGIISSDAFLDEWNTDVTLLNALGLGLEQTVIYVYREAPDFNNFEEWILTKNNNVLQHDKIQTFNNTFSTEINQSNETTIIESVLNEEDIDFWNTNGYVIVRNAVSKQDCDAVIEAICEFIHIDLTNPATWYNDHPAKQGIMVQMFQHPSLEKNRNSSRIRAAYEQLWQRKDLWVSTDRVSFNPPENQRWQFPGPNMHWDVSLDLPIPFGLQGLLYLSDTQANQGAFTLVPGFHNSIENWINSLPAGSNPRNEDIHQLGSIPIIANAGDFIIWHQALPHGSSANTSDRPRLVQYINYSPIDAEIKMKWK